MSFNRTREGAGDKTNLSSLISTQGDAAPPVQLSLDWSFTIQPYRTAIFS